MTPEPLDRIRSLLSRALSLPEADRMQFVETQSEGDPELLGELESLLSLHESAEGFMRTPLPELLDAGASPHRELPLGSLLNGRYRIDRVLAVSGFATVYFAQDEHVIGRPVVIKLLDRIHGSEALRGAFESELQSLGRLQHPNVVSISDIGELDDGSPFLVLAYIHGLTLRQVLETGPLPLSRVRTIVGGIAKALSAAHRSGILHLDIKPENIIVSDQGTPDERVTVIDFGIARLRSLPGAALSAGSPRYMAPEQPRSPSVQSDIYSLGLVAFELLTGHLPDRSRPIGNQLPPGVSRQTARALATALAERPEDRFATVGAFIEAWDAVPIQRAILPWLAPVGAFALGSAFLLFFHAQRTPESLYSKPIPLITTPGRNRQPAFSPDGNWIYFVGGSTENQKVYEKSLSAGDPVVISGEGDRDVHVRCSPDGKSLAILRETPFGRTVILRSLQPGGGEVEIGRGYDYGSISWSANGRFLALEYGDYLTNASRLQVLDIETRRTRQLWEDAPGIAGDRLPVLSPDGKSLAFVRYLKTGSVDLMIAPVDDTLNLLGPPRILIGKQDRIGAVQWTPDSKELFYLAGPYGNGSIWRVAAEGGDPRPVLPGAGQVENIAIPAKAWKLAYSVYTSDVNVWQYDLDAQIARPVITQTQIDNDARHSPDGAAIAFSSSRTGSEQIWLAKADGSDSRQVTNFHEADTVSAVWTPDSKDLIISVRSATLGIHTYRAAATAPFGMTELLPDAFACAVSHDGKWMYFRSLRTGQWQLWRTNYPGASHFERITTAGGYECAEAPDGKSLYFTKRHEREGIWRMPLPAGPAAHVVEKLYRRNLFAPSKRGLYYIAPQGDSPLEALFFRDGQSGVSTRIHVFNKQIFWGLDLSPDERSLLFSQYDLDSADIKLIENLR